MSEEATGWAWLHVKCGEPNTKAVITCLAFNSNESGVSGISQQVIAELTELSLSTVKRRIKYLEQCGVITVTRKQIGEQKRRNFYQLNMQTAFDLTGGCVTPVESTGVRGTPYRCQGDTIQVSGGHHESAHRCQADPTQVSLVTHSTNYLNLSNYLDSTGVTQTPVEKQVMSSEWVPLDHVFEVLSAEGMAEDWILKQLPDFRVYWIDRGSARDDFSVQFMNHCRFQAGEQKQGKGRASDASDDQSKMSRLVSREWNDG